MNNNFSLYSTEAIHKKLGVNPSICTDLKHHTHHKITNSAKSEVIHTIKLQVQQNLEMKQAYYLYVNSVRFNYSLFSY